MVFFVVFAFSSLAAVKSYRENSAEKSNTTPADTGPEVGSPPVKQTSNISDPSIHLSPQPPAAEVTEAKKPDPITESLKPKAQTIFEPRQWTSADGQRTFLGKLIKMSDGQVTVEKDGDEITFPMEKLSEADRRFLGQGVTITTSDGIIHENGSVTGITAEIIEFKKSSGLITIPMENLPENLRHHFAYDPKIAAELREAKERQLAAMKEREAVAASQKSAQDNLDTFMAVLEAAGVGNALVTNVSTEGETITITVATAWHYQPKQVRQQSAQILWQTWAMIASPDKLDHARLSLRDAVGNEVGGSRILAGSLIWVDD